VLDSKGLLVRDRGSLDEIKAGLATDPADISGWHERSDPPSLLEVVRNVQPTVLIGVSGVGGLFTKEVVEEMARGCDRPVILALSNPTSHTEITPADAISWTRGRAIVAAGSPFSPVVHDGTAHRIGQANNVFIFPGMGLGVIAVGAREVTDSMFLEAAKALSSATRLEDVAQGQLYPHIEDVRDVSRAVAIAVASRAIKEGVADPVDDVEAAVDAEMWFPEYIPMRASDETR